MPIYYSCLLDLCDHHIHSMNSTPLDEDRLYQLCCTEEDEASKVGTDHLIRNITSVWKQDPGIQELEEDGSQRDGGAALQGRGSGICGHVGQLCGE